MIKHYFKIAVRNLVRQKALSFINVFGLSVGFACFILFLLFAVNEFSFDRFHKNADNKTGNDRLVDRFAFGVVLYAQMAAGFCLSHFNRLVDIYRRRLAGFDHGICYDCISGDKSWHR